MPTPSLCHTRRQIDGIFIIGVQTCENSVSWRIRRFRRSEAVLHSFMIMGASSGFDPLRLTARGFLHLTHVSRFRCRSEWCRSGFVPRMLVDPDVGRFGRLGPVCRCSKGCQTKPLKTPLLSAMSANSFPVHVGDVQVVIDSPKFTDNAPERFMCQVAQVNYNTGLSGSRAALSTMKRTTARSSVARAARRTCSQSASSQALLSTTST